MANFNFMQSAKLLFKGSDHEEVQECFTAGKFYHADQTSNGDFRVNDDNGDNWHIDRDDDDFEVIQ